MTRAFISHATEDRFFVEKELNGLLRAVGLDVWYAEENIQTSQQWERAILSGLENSKWFILVMSLSAAKSEWVKDEVHWAMDERQENIIPILIDDCDTKAFHIRLPRIQRLDFRTDLHDARENLVALLVNHEYKLINRTVPEAAYIGINALIQSSALPMYFVDNDLKIKFHNNQLSTFLCFNKTEVYGMDLQTLVDRFIDLAQDDTREELKKKQKLLLESSIPDHCEEEDIIDLRKKAGNQYQGLQRVWVSADRVYFPGNAEPLGLFVVYHPAKIDS